MKIAVTGSSKLANCIQGNKIRVEFGADWSQYDVFVNNAHVEWEQCRLLEEVYEVWKDDETKTIDNDGEWSCNNIFEYYGLTPLTN